MKIGAGGLGVAASIIEPTINYILICTIAVLMDCFAAWRLSRRVKKTTGKSDGKFRSSSAKKAFGTIWVICSLILLAFLIDEYIIPTASWYLPNIVAGAFCFLQIWSILENESSCNGSRWAKVAQKIMVNKAERHFNVDLSDLKDDES